MTNFWRGFWQRWNKRQCRSSRSLGGRTKRSTIRLEVVLLEDRVVPSSFPATLVNFLGMSTADTGLLAPPDPSIAVGPNHVVETVNTDIKIWNKSGTALTGAITLTAFFTGIVPSGVSIGGDPVATYDELTGRFFVGVMAWDSSFTSTHFLYGVSKTADPTGAYFLYDVNLTANDPAGTAHSGLGVFPRVGWNASEFAVSFNMFTNGSGTLDHVVVLNIDSTAAGTGVQTTTLADVAGGLANVSLAPATMHGASASDPMYFVEDTYDSLGNPSGNSIRVVTETSALTTPSFAHTDIALPMADDFLLPPNATQEGTTNTLNTQGDSFGGMLNAEWRDHHLVAAQTIGVAADAQAHARWYDVDTTTASPTLIQDGTIGVNSGTNSYFPAITIAANDSLAMTWIESSPTEFMSMAETGRLVSDPSGQMATPVVERAGASAYTFGTSATVHTARAGDFSGIAADPSDGSFWAASEYAISTSSWGTAITQARFPPADLTASETHTSPVGSSWTWTIHVANNGNPAPFSYGQTILLDNLPASNISYGTVSFANQTNISGSGVLSGTIDIGGNLTVTASGGSVIIGVGGSFDVSFTATIAAFGTYANPRGGGLATVDPNNAITESNKSNNSFSDTVTISQFSDTFSGGNAPDLGPAWTVPTFAPALRFHYRRPLGYVGFQVNGGGAVTLGGASQAAADQVAGMSFLNPTLQADVTASDPQALAGLFARMTSSGEAYVAILTSNRIPEILLYQATTNTFSPPLAQGTALSGTGAVTLQFVLNGPNLTLKDGIGNVLASTSDMTLTGAGAAGIFAWGTTGTIDNFSISGS
jgi:hypothetical protein